MSLDLHVGYNMCGCVLAGRRLRCPLLYSPINDHFSSFFTLYLYYCPFIDIARRYEILSVSPLCVCVGESLGWGGPLVHDVPVNKQLTASTQGSTSWLNQCAQW